MNSFLTHDPTSNGSLYALSATQLAMATFVLTHDATGTSHGFDTEQLHLRLKHALDVPKLRAAWNIVSRHHAILTTSIDWRSSQFVLQRTHPDVEIPVQVITLDSDDPAELEALLRRDREQGFRLDCPPLQRVTAIATPAGITQLLWTVHHILIDGRSFEPILGDIFSAYDQLLEGTSTAQLPSRRPFRDYIASLNGSRQVPDVQAPPVGRSVARILTNSLESGPIEFATIVEHSALASRILEFASASGVSSSTVLTAAWALTLARLGGSPDVRFSVSRHGRSGLAGEAKKMIGPFTLTAPLQLELEPSQVAGQFLTQVQQQLRELSTLEASSLLNTSQANALDPDALPETHFLFENSDPEVDIPRSAQLAPHIQAIRIHERTTFPITLTIHSSSQFRITLSYQTHRCPPALAARLLKSFLYNLEALTLAPQEQLCQFDGIPPEDRRLLLDDWAATAGDFPRDDLIHTAFSRQCELAPRAIAIEHQGSQISYADLDARSNQLAHYLRERGVGAHDVVAIYLRRSPLLVVAILAVAKLGAVYVAIDPRYPAPRRQFMSNDCNARLVLTDVTTHDLANDAALNLESESLQLALATQPASLPSGSSRAEDACYIMYTSGSTGQPKGAILTHRAVNNTLGWVNRTFSVEDGDKLLFVNSPSFDLSVYDIFGTLAAGGTIHISSAEASTDPASLAQTLISGGITIWNSTPSLLQLLLQYVPSTPSHTLRLILLSGDWIPIPLIAQLRELFPSAELVSLGGATEAAIWSNYFIIKSISSHWRSVPYGRPIQNCQYYILNETMQLVPIGTVGELFIGGECVASGYLNRAELTHSRFPPNPFAHGRLYRTGDLCRYLDDDGNIEILGRKDNQVKIRGFRVELGEIEHALLQLPQIQAAACTTSRDASNQLSIVAFVVLDASADFDEASLHNRLHAYLPDFMLPARIVRLPALPISSTGKVDRAALRAPDAEATAPSTRATSGSEEELLIAIWQKLLHRRSIQPTDDFFELGGHSLLAIHLTQEISRTFAVEVHLGTLFQHRTPRQLAARLAALRASQAGPDPWTSLVPIQPLGDLPALFCVAGAGGSPVEERLLAKTLGKRQPFYGIQLGLLPHKDGPPTVEQIANSILSDLHSSTFRGPYFIAGFSAGGVIAQELARQLRHEGYEVPLLTLLDAFNPTLGRWSTLERMIHFTGMLRTYGLSYSLKRLHARAQYKLMTGIPGLGAADLAAVQAQTTHAIDHHVPQRYSGPTLLIRTAAKPVVDIDYRTDPSNGWASCITNLQIITIDGRHDQLLTTQAGVVAGHLRNALALAQQVGSTEAIRQLTISD